ncbi:hypothetical protein [Candidatus Puniceispirillum sp.]|jgi:hypothetical protein|uniref:hypothetical protein n=1 Tax=Candidatus Puniceispirillum sp. TaxID=2026719 RepID=UPI001ECAE960|nr:hypothetical protein [Candidatus Puniceispirillum sp.]MBT6567065.1 hypothetical protein [Candidatus Puniceispirillum sp.]
MVRMGFFDLIRIRVGVLLLCSLAMVGVSKSASANSTAIMVTEFGQADLTVRMKSTGDVDEVWRVTGSCQIADTYLSVQVKDYGYADLTVKIQSKGDADKQICIKNPEDVPEWMMKMLF